MILPYAKQAGPRSSFAKSDSLERGFIDSLDFKVNGKQVKWTLHPEWIDVVKIELNEVLKPGQTINIETPFFVKIPKVFSLGHTGKHYEITQWYPSQLFMTARGGTQCLTLTKVSFTRSLEHLTLK